MKGSEKTKEKFLQQQQMSIDNNVVPNGQNYQTVTPPTKRKAPLLFAVVALIAIMGMIISGCSSKSENNNSENNGNSTDNVSSVALSEGYQKLVDSFGDTFHLLYLGDSIDFNDGMRITIQAMDTRAVGSGSDVMVDLSLNLTNNSDHTIKLDAEQYGIGCGFDELDSLKTNHDVNPVCEDKGQEIKSGESFYTHLKFGFRNIDLSKGTIYFLQNSSILIMPVANPDGTQNSATAEIVDTTKKDTDIDTDSDTDSDDDSDTDSDDDSDSDNDIHVEDLLYLGDTLKFEGGINIEFLDVETEPSDDGVIIGWKVNITNTGRSTEKFKMKNYQFKCVNDTEFEDMATSQLETDGNNEIPAGQSVETYLLFAFYDNSNVDLDNVFLYQGEDYSTAIVPKKGS